MKLEVREIKQVIDAVFDHILDDLKIETLTINGEVDFYWEVPNDTLFDAKNDPPELSIGRLSDDWDFLRRILDNPTEASSLMLTHAAPLLRYLGEKIGQ